MKNIKINNAGETGMNRNTEEPIMKKTDISSSMNSFNRIRVGTATVITAFATMALTAQAAVVVNSVNDPSDTMYSSNVSSVDLLNGLVPESQSGTWNAGGTIVLNDGVHGPGSGSVPDVATAAWAYNGDTVTYDLGVGGGSGWSLTSITTIAAWVGSGFGSQDFKIETEGVGGGGFALLTTQEYQPLGYNGAGSTQVTLTDDSGFLATGVQKIRFTQNLNDDAFAGTGEGTVYRELDVFGVQTTAPEPSTLGLLGVGFGMLLATRRRVRS